MKKKPIIGIITGSFLIIGVMILMFLAAPGEDVVEILRIDQRTVNAHPLS